MGKSKFQAKAHEQLQKQKEVGTLGNTYYDEGISTGPQKSNVGYAIFIMVVILTGGVVMGVYFANNPTNPDDGNDTTNTLPTVPSYNSQGYWGTEEQAIVSEATQNANGIQTGDNVELEYKLWVADSEGPYGIVDTSATPYQANTFTTEASRNSLINGFYLNILGLEVGETKQFELPANIDADQDGKDDRTGETVMGYTSGDLADTNLVFWVRVISINA